MNSKSFLLWGGLVMVLIGISGFFLTGPTAQQSIFGSTWYLSRNRSLAYLLVGVIALLIAYLSKSNIQKWVTLVIGVVLALIGLYGFVRPTLLGISLGTIDDVVNLVIGIWALWAALGRKSATTAS